MLVVQTAIYDSAEYSLQPHFDVLQNPAKALQTNRIRHSSLLIQYNFIFRPLSILHLITTATSMIIFNRP